MIDPNDYWVNNPLISPVNKALLYDNDIDRAKHDERERIIALLEPFTHLKCELSCDDCDDDFAYAIALIKGEQK